MKDFKITVALFTTFMLILPFISVNLCKKVQLQNAKYSSGQNIDEEDVKIELKQDGTFKILRTRTGMVEEIPAVDYICGVVAAEMPASYHEEALKAQAVASYTYALYQRDYSRARAAAAQDADLSDDYHQYQAYISKQEEAQKKWGANAESNWNRIYAAVCAVQDYAITYRGKPIEAGFFAVSSGRTENSADIWGNAQPYLTSVQSEWDLQSNHYLSTVTVKRKDFESAVKAKYGTAKFTNNPANWLTDIRRSAAGGVISANLCGVTVKGADIRTIFGLRSNNFSLSYKDGLFTFTVKGYGHGVGMSQYGAQCLALQGKKWDEIIKYYYRGVELTRIDW